MKRLGFITFMSLCLMLLMNCKSVSKQSEDSEIDDLKELLETKYGACTLKKKASENTVDKHQQKITINKGEIADAYPKSMVSYGMQFEAMSGVSNAFLIDVAKTYMGMFPKGDEYDSKKQQQVLNAMLQYQAFVPVLAGHHDNLPKDAEEGMIKVEKSNYSVCDVIMYGDPNQPMEVVEHLLHFITDIGLFYTYPEEWSFMNDESHVFKSMTKAIEKGYYEIETYSDEEAVDEVYKRILVQEYAYWIITSYWDLQERYGPHEAEWKLLTREQLRKHLPRAYDLVHSTVGNIMRAPSINEMESFKKYQQ
jgi:hypothetical protein